MESNSWSVRSRWLVADVDRLFGCAGQGRNQCTLLCHGQYKRCLTATPKTCKAFPEDLDCIGRGIQVCNAEYDLCAIGCEDLACHSNEDCDGGQVCQESPERVCGREASESFFAEGPLDTQAKAACGFDGYDFSSLMGKLFTVPLASAPSDTYWFNICQCEVNTGTRLCASERLFFLIYSSFLCLLLGCCCSAGGPIVNLPSVCRDPYPVYSNISFTRVDYNSYCFDFGEWPMDSAEVTWSYLDPNVQLAGVQYTINGFSPNNGALEASSTNVQFTCAPQQGTPVVFQLYPNSPHFVSESFTSAAARLGTWLMLRAAG